MRPFTEAEIAWFQLRAILRINPADIRVRPVDPPPRIYWQIIEYVIADGNRSH